MLTWSDRRATGFMENCEGNHATIFGIYISLQAEAWCAGLRKLAAHSLMESAYDRCTV
ncbi:MULTISPECIES: hypothetical protein [Kosakonia]|uniref:hypothetical protein n=1 Tax=Kosakonia TaxID=1330547 RepID=UPI0012DBF9E2|nr:MULTISPECIES: hypothetical protein [Kosakonia]MDD7995484.1 hypothetical protein [Kosakonia radicincitans]